jgi:hypothetical protein
LEELCTLHQKYYKGDKIKDEMGRACSTQGREGKRLPRRPRHKWEDNIRLGLREIGWKGMNWIHLAQDRDQWWSFVNKGMNLQVL